MKKRYFFISILLIICLFILTGCARPKKVKLAEVKKFTKSLYKFDENVKDLSFYYDRRTLYAKLYYTDLLNDEKLKSLENEFKKLINIDLMKKVGDKYGKGTRLDEFFLNIYIGYDKNIALNDYDYKILSRYNKTPIVDENPDNIDGYKTWHIEVNKQ